MHAFSPIAGARKTQMMRAGVMGRGGRQASITAVRQFFRPSVLAFLSLALVVGAFGYGSKLNQYRHLFQVNKPSAVRMWVGHRDDSFELSVHHSPQRLPGSESIAASVPPLRLAGWSRDFVLAPPVPLRPAFLASSLIPFRAPPSSHSSLV